ncbi:macrolide ABC transporter ATP-binding protein [Clostridia bacterium]|nr:macrolide ABC transporter ATP-binding protein [Clostridia bacterium]
MIKAQSIFKTFTIGGESVNVLNDINIEINDGEFVSVTGASGSGKSTLLYLLGALDAPTSGEIIVDGTHLSKMNDKQTSEYRRKRVGFVFQFYNLIQNLTVEENIVLPVVLDGKKAKGYAAKSDELIALVGLENVRKQKGALLSGGQQQRVAIARALINDPHIILADEPIGNLDSVKSAEIMKLLQKINREKGVTIVQVTHSRESVGYGTREIRLQDGKVV